MTRRRRKRALLSVSLFPFLAVLICTLGVLVLMLVMAVKSADEQGLAQSTVNQETLQQQETIAQSLRDQLDIRTAQIEGILESRPDALRRLEDAREYRIHLQDEIRDASAEAKRIVEQLNTLDADASADDTAIEGFDDELALLKRKRDAAQNKLDEKAETKQQIGDQRYAIVPYRGSGGTLRRPIYVECTADAILLQPHNIRIPVSDFVPPLETGNMLDAALITTRSYLQKYADASDDEKPYPLLIVRPDAATTYGLARRAMSSWDDEFGYELVETDTLLDFGPPNELLAAEIRKSVAEAKQRQSVIAMRRAAFNKSAARFDTRRRKQSGLLVAGSRGGFVSQTGFEGSGSDAASRIGDGTGGNRQSRSSTGESSNGESGSNQAASGGASGGQQSQMSQAGGSGPGGDGNMAGGQAAEASPSSSEGQSCPAGSLAQQRGANWAVQGGGPRATAYLRPIRVTFTRQGLNIAGGQGTTFIPAAGDDAVALTDNLVVNIKREIENWGLAGQQAYWKPELRVTVQPGGETTFANVRQLLQNSGVAIEGGQP